MPPPNIEVWRRIVLLMILHQQNGGTTGTIAHRARRWGWRLFPDRLLVPTQEMSDRTLTSRALKRCNAQGYVYSIPHASGDLYWTITAEGRDIAKAAHANPHITKENLSRAWS
jgi:hypothetical protein